MLRMFICTLAVTLASALFNPIFAADKVFGARYPGLSPDGSTVVFEYWGDIWSAPVDGSGLAWRLTDHQAFDQQPRFSPDGTKIAFVSNRSGNSDIWIIPAEGGVARQVTKLSGSENLQGFSADGKRIIYTSNLGLWGSSIFHIDIDGSDPAVKVTGYDHFSVSEAAELDDGGWLYSRGGGRWWRKNYRGTSQLDLWRMYPDGHNERLTDFAGRDAWPMVAKDGTAYFVSDRDGIDNLWSYNMDTGAAKQATFHTADGVQYASIAPGGNTMAYEFAGQLYTYETGGKPQRLKLNIAAEGKGNWVVKKTFNNDATEYATSPHGKYTVVVVEGDLWAVKDPEGYGSDEKPDQDLAEALRLTASDGARERSPSFSKDNLRFAYASDADGDYEIYIMDLADMSVMQVTQNDYDDLSPRFDPSDENVLFYNSGNRTIVREELDSGATSTVAEGRFRQAFNHLDYDISPDGAWVAYVDELDDWSHEIFVVKADGGGKPFNVTRHPGDDGSPRWSADGSRLVFSARRNEASAVYVIDLVPEAETYDLEFLFADDQPKDNGDDEEGEDNGDDEDDKKNDDDSEDAKDDGKVVIDFEDIHRRARKVSTQDNGGDPLVSIDGKWVVYETNPDNNGAEVWAVKAEGGSARKLMDGNFSGYAFAAKGKRLYYRDGGTVRYMKWSDGSNKGTATISAKGDFWLDQRARWHQMYREGWRTLGERFYDANMHGADWDAVYEKYLPFIDYIGTPEEFGLMFSEVLGELNGSHLAIYGPRSDFSVSGHSTGHLGLEFDAAFKGPGLKVSRITYRGPADKPGVEIAEGDVVLEILGEPVSMGMRWIDLLEDRVGDPVQITVADGDMSREVVIKATSYGGYQSLLYREWELENQHIIDEMSEGRIGYIHIRGMNGSEWRKFEQELYSELFDRDALIVDVRFNGGGWLHESLFDAFDKKPFGFSGGRGAGRVMQPPSIYQKPKALLINSRSGSDAEIFPAGWRALGLGPVVGIDTAGAVIGTTGFTLIDGTYVRLPVEGWWELDGRNLETSGTPPDYYVDVHPDELKNGIDAQLVKAVELLLVELD